jgi:uncharacterized SAM-binding protein YcdF (DUF218 family)
MRHKLGGRYLLFSALAILIIFTLSRSYAFLSYSRSVSPEILVVEGWMTEEALLKSRDEFLRNHYQYLITTGFPHHDGYRMPFNGKIIFNIKNLVEKSPDNRYIITILARGTKAFSKYAHFRAFADTIELGDHYTGPGMNSYEFRIKLEKPPDSIRVEFDNDNYTTYRDRDLYVYSVSINNRVLSVNNKEVSYYYRQNGVYYLYEQLMHSRALSAANLLVHKGLPDSLVHPVESIHRIKSRTYTTALDVRKWIAQHDERNLHSITIVTQGCHARRSYLSYKKAFGDSVNIGVICLPEQDMNSSNWFMSINGWKNVLYELAGLIYVRVFI